MSDLSSFGREAFDFAFAVWHQWKVYGITGIIVGALEFITKHKKWSFFDWLQKKNQHHALTFAAAMLGIIFTSFMAYNEVNTDTTLWKPLTKVQISRFLESERPQQNYNFGPIGIFYRSDCDKCRDYAVILQKIMLDAGWNVDAAVPEYGNSLKGIYFSFGKDTNALSALDILTTEFRSAKIHYAISQIPAMSLHMFDIVVGKSK